MTIDRGAQGDEADGPFRIVAELPTVKGPAKKPTSQHNMLAVDADSRRMFLMHPDVDNKIHVVTYDLRPRVPRQVRIGEVGKAGDFPVANLYSAAFDRKRSNLGILSGTIRNDAHDIPAENANLVIYGDLQSKVLARWNLNERLPGFYAMGITYSPADDLYYLAGEFSQNRFLADGTPVFGSKPAGPVSAVAAIRADTGALQFVRAVSECQQVLYSKGIGSLIARSKAYDAVYFPCVSGGTAAGQTYPGQAGLVRLTVNKADDTAAAAQRKVEFFPISGNYFAGGSGSGVAGFDSTTDRFYFQSISFKTPGAWVFDGRLTAWVGFVAATRPVNYFIGVHEGLGHLYMGLTSGGTATAVDGIIVADVRQTPVPAGESDPLSTSTLIATDARSTRLFVRPRAANDPYLVVEDLTPETRDVDEIDYDRDTSDTPDTPSAEVFYAAGATGYGAQAVQVGGGTSPATAVGPASESLPKVAPNTRALMTSRVGGVDLRNSGAAASAQAALPDYTTITEYEGEHGPWPYPIGTCLDAGGAPETKTWDDAPGGAADEGEWTITCDLAKKYVKASTRMGVSGSGALRVKRTSYVAEGYRNTREGGVMSTRVTADGVTFEVAGGADIRIGSVVATSKSEAHGRPGTAKSSWTRDVKGVRILNASGAPVFTSPGCSSTVTADASGKTVQDDCAALAAVVNRVLPTRFKLEFPLAEAIATPKGAFAGIEQTKAQYFNQTVVNEQGVVYRGDSIGLRAAPALVAEAYNDTTERSRTIAVLAATQSNSVFTIMPPYEPGCCDPDPGPDPVPTGDTGGLPGVTPGGTTTTGGTPGGTGTVEPAGPVQVGPQPVAIPAADVRGFLLMRRSARDALLMLLLAGLLLAGLGTAWRRHRLVQVLVTVPRKDTA